MPVLNTMDVPTCVYIVVLQMCYTMKQMNLNLGKGKILRQGQDVALIATGVVMVGEALKAADLLADKGISATVVDMHTIETN